MAKSDYGKRPSEGWSKDYEKAWLRANGDICKYCNGTGVISDDIGEGLSWNSTCEICNGTGYVKKEEDQ